jgi:hypothetical protein
VRNRKTLAHLGWTRKFAKAANNEEPDSGKTPCKSGIHQTAGGLGRVILAFPRIASTMTNGVEDLRCKLHNGRMKRMPLGDVPGQYRGVKKRTEECQLRGEPTPECIPWGRHTFPESADQSPRARVKDARAGRHTARSAPTRRDHRAGA